MTLAESCHGRVFSLAMKRLLHIVLLALFLGPQVGTILVPREGVCQETDDCCPPGGVCNVNCVTCACCMSRPTNCSSVVTLDPIAGASSPAMTLAGSVSLPLFSTEILHVPKSV